MFDFRPLRDGRSFGERPAFVVDAMKAVEVYVREAAKLPNTPLGVKLARTAFDPANGPLTSAR